VECHRERKELETVRHGNQLYLRVKGNQTVSYQTLNHQDATDMKKEYISINITIDLKSFHL